jgi:transposase-like protein
MSIEEAEGFGAKRRKRRSWTLEEKRRIVDQSLDV